MRKSYGDKRLLAERYTSMQHFIAFLEQTSRKGKRAYTDYTGWHGFGDWLALDGSDGREGGTSKELIATAFFAYSTRLLSQIAEILAKPFDAQRYAKLADGVRDAFCRDYVNLDGTIVGGTQTSYILALHFNLLPKELRMAAATELRRNIEQAGNHLSTGFVGTPYINWVLTDAGYLDTAYTLLKQTTWPSWLYSVIQGATTIWERWDGWTHDKGFQDAGMNSFNHYAYGAVGAWLYDVVGGIDLDPTKPGYKHIVMRPQPGGGLSSASAELQSIYGLIRSAWTLSDNAFEWHIVIPANTTAKVYIPITTGMIVYEGGIPATESVGLRFVGHEVNVAVYEVESGRYHFKVERVSALSGSQIK